MADMAMNERVPVFAGAEIIGFVIKDDEGVYLPSWKGRPLPFATTYRDAVSAVWELQNEIARDDQLSRAGGPPAGTP